MRTLVPEPRSAEDDPTGTEVDPSAERVVHDSGHRSGRTDLSCQVAAVLVFLVAALLPIGDFSPTFSAFGQAGARPAGALIPVLLLLLVRNGSDRPTPGERLFRRAACVLLVYALLVTSVTLPFMPAVVRQESVPVKAVKVFLTILLWLGTLTAAAMAYRRHPQALRRGCTAALLGSLVYLVAEKYVPGNALVSSPLLHATENVQQRPRILSTEASVAGASLMALAGMVVLLDRRGWARTLVLLATTWGVWVVRSRGTDTSWRIALLLVVVLFVVRAVAAPVLRQRWGTALAVVAVAFAAFNAGALIHAMFDPSAKTAGSDATRATYAASALVVLQDEPWGGGFARPLVETQNWLEAGYEQLAPLYPTKAFQEISDVIRQTSDRALGPKTLPVALIYYGGVVGALFWLLLVVALVRHTQWLSRTDVVATVAPVGVLIATCSYVSSIYELEIVLVLGAAFGAWSRPTPRPETDTGGGTAAVSAAASSAPRAGSTVH